MNKSRFEAFSDGVYSFAVTLLILGIVLPQLRAPSESELTAALVNLWPNVLAYLLSFAVIGIMWQNHHAIFRRVAHIDRRTVFINLMLLGATVFVRPRAHHERDALQSSVEPLDQVAFVQ